MGGIPVEGVDDWEGRGVISFILMIHIEWFHARKEKTVSQWPSCRRMKS